MQPARSGGNLFYFLNGRYWKPVLLSVRRRGCAHEEAEDRVQGFFRFAFDQNLFAKADPKRGRFRNLLLSSLNNYLANQHRWEHAQKRRPEKGFVDIHNLISDRMEDGELSRALCLMAVPTVKIARDPVRPPDVQVRHQIFVWNHSCPTLGSRVCT